MYCLQAAKLSKGIAYGLKQYGYKKRRKRLQCLHLTNRVTPITSEEGEARENTTYAVSYLMITQMPDGYAPFSLPQKVKRGYSIKTHLNAHMHALLLWEQNKKGHRLQNPLQFQLAFSIGRIQQNCLIL